MSTNRVSPQCSPQRSRRHRHDICYTPRSRRKNICCICLESICVPDTAGIDCCDHLYHKDCIESWSHIENACPLCKKRFLSINHISDGNKSITVEKKDQEAAYHIDLGHIIWVDCECIKCGANDNEHLLLLCDGCDVAMHTYCVGLGDHVPDGDFFCETCQSQIDNLFLAYQSNSDEEYHPSPQHTRTTRRRRRSTRNTNTNRRRSQRIRNNHSDGRARSVSPSAPTQNRRRMRVQRMMVMDQNNQRHLLGFERNTHGVRFSSLANLFNGTRESILKEKLDKAKAKIESIKRKTSLSLLSVGETQTSGSEYTPSDDHEESDSDCDCDCVQMRHLRRSKRLQNSNSCSDTSEDSDLMQYKLRRKRKFSQMEEADDHSTNTTGSAPKRAKIAPLTTRKYSSLILL
eukprot:65716_1